MGIREQLNHHPQVVTFATVGLITCALAYIVFQMVTDPSGWGKPRAITEVYYTSDDGATLFSGSVELVPPFSRDGKPAVRAHVYRCGTGAPFVGFLERFPPDVVERIREARKQLEASRDPAASQLLATTSTEVKRPGPSDTWTNMNDLERYNRAIEIRCPDATMQAEPVFP